MSERHLLVAIAVGVMWGLVGRLVLLRVDYRSYPSYPHAYTVHLAFGFLAGLVGAVAPAALAAGQYDAVTFLLLVATQFREVRRMERDKLQELESIELVPRGANYIEGIAEVFELRNYLVMLLGAASSGVVILWSPIGGLAAGALLVGGVRLIRGDLRLKDVAVVRQAPIRFDGANLYVGDVQIMNVGLPHMKERIEEWGVGLTVEPRRDEFRGVISNMGQRQAIVHDLVHVMGNRQDVDTPELKPMARKNLEKHIVGLYFCPAERDPERAIRVAQEAPLLNNARRGAGEGL